MLPAHCSWDHAIDLISDAKPHTGKIYPMSRDEQTALNEPLEENLHTSRIRPSISPWASPSFFGKKKDTTTLRPIQDYQKLNDLTIKNHYPLPLISELVDQLTDSIYFTKMDV